MTNTKEGSASSKAKGKKRVRRREGERGEKEQRQQPPRGPFSWCRWSALGLVALAGGVLLSKLVQPAPQALAGEQQQQQRERSPRSDQSETTKTPRGHRHALEIKSWMQAQELAFDFAQEGRLDEAITLYQLAIGRAPEKEQVTLLANKAALYLEGGQLQQSSEVIAEALWREPLNKQVLSVTLDVLDLADDEAQMPRVKDLVDSALSVGLAHAAPYTAHDMHFLYLLSRHASTLGLQDQALPLVRAFLAKPPPPEDILGPEAATFYAGLVRLLDEMELTEEAFHAAQIMNEKARKKVDLPAFMRSYTGHVEMSKLSFNAAFLEQLPVATTPVTHRGGDKSQHAADRPFVPVFAVGYPRSGTTLVDQILSRHPLVHSNGERSMLQEIAGRIKTLGVKQHGLPVLEYLQTRLDQPTVDYFAEELVTFLRQNVTEKEVSHVVSNSNLDILSAWLVPKLLPSAKLVFVERDAMDACLSVLLRSFASPQLAFSCDQEAIAKHYLLWEDLMQHWEEVLGLPVLKIRYERLVGGDQREVTAELLEFLGLPWAEECMSPEQSSRSPVLGAVSSNSAVETRSKVNAKAMGRWKRYEAFLGPMSRILDRR